MKPEEAEKIPWIVVLCPSLDEDTGHRYKPHTCNDWMEEPCGDCPILEYYHSSTQSPIEEDS